MPVFCAGLKLTAMQHNNIFLIAHFHFFLSAEFFKTVLSHPEFYEIKKKFKVLKNIIISEIVYCAMLVASIKT